MSTIPRPRRLRAVGGALLLVALALPGTALALVPEVAPDLLPDLRMRKPTEFRIERPTDAGPRRLLRFTTTFVNVGDGPFEVRGARDCTSLTSCPLMTVRQRLRRSDDSWHHVDTTARMKLEVGDRHGHWHVIGMERFELFDLAQPRGGVALRGDKFGFCFFDVRPYRLSLPGAPTSGRYVESGPPPNSGCGTGSSLTTRMGLSVGWQDIYPWNFAGQFIDISGVADGEYLLCVTADPKDRFDEARENNNQAWTRLRITGSRVAVLGQAKQHCDSQLPIEEPPP